MYLISAGKFITHIAALQLVDRGLVRLDDPIYNLLPELEAQPIICPDTNIDGPGFKLLPQTSAITLRHMLTNSSGIADHDDALFKAWRSAASPQEWPENTSSIIKNFCGPLLFQPGQGWCYGHDVHFLQLVISRALGGNKTFVDCMQELIFEPLGMKSTTYLLHQRPDIKKKLLQFVEKGEDGQLSAVPEDRSWGITSTISDVQTLLTDLINPQPKVLSVKSAELFFKPAFEPSSSALAAFRAQAKDFTGPTGWSTKAISLPVNYTCAGAMVLEEDSPNLPKGFLNWMGMSNFAWALHREKGLAILFGAQLMPEYDEKTMRLMEEFFHASCLKFAQY